MLELIYLGYEKPWPGEPAGDKQIRLILAVHLQTGEEPFHAVLTEQGGEVHDSSEIVEQQKSYSLVLLLKNMIRFIYRNYQNVELVR